MTGIRVRDPWPSEHFDTFTEWMDQHRAGFVADIADLVRIPSTSPNEQAVFEWSAEYFGKLAESIELEPRHSGVGSHPAGNDNEFLRLPPAERGTLRVDFGGAHTSPRTLFSAHVDVVPATAAFGHAFEPVVMDGFLVGRGSTDTKGNIILLTAALRYLADTGQRHRRTSLDLVVEEEIGGNGALSGCLHGRDVDEVVVLEPTGLEVFHGHRGCIEFTVEINGAGGHMGAAAPSAIKGALRYVDVLSEIEASMVDVARADPVFAGFDRPVQINVGSIHGGEWHGSSPECCTIGASFGFHPSLGPQDVAAIIDGIPDRLPEPWSRADITVTYNGIHNEAYLGDADAPVAGRLRAAVRAAGVHVNERRAWCVSCDARLYHKLLGVPTVIFGAGQLAEAHSAGEKLALAEWERGVLALAYFLSADAERSTSDSDSVEAGHS